MDPQAKPTLFFRILRIIRFTVWIAVTVIFLFLVFVPFFTSLSFASNLNTKDTILNKNSKGVVLLDRQGRPFFTFFGGHEKGDLSLSDIPKATQQAVIASEDKNFYEHNGFSPKAIARSLIANIKERSFSYGGSTITQQLVKNTLLSSQKNVLRKYEEIILARDLEERFSKDELLGMYLQTAYFGEGAIGVKEAAHIYFNKDPRDLTLAQSALLAGILPAPSELSPISGDLEKAQEKQQVVLTKMVEQGYITEEEKSQAETEDLALDPQVGEMNSKAPHFALMVRDELIKKYGEEEIARSGFLVTTTVDLDWQQYAEEVVKNQVERLRGNRVSNASAVVLDPKSGEIRAIVGSRDWNEDGFGKVNVALMLRQPGSSFKPIVYITAFEKGVLTPATLLKDQAITYASNGSPPYSPLDFDRKFRGQVLVRRALSNSLNIPAVEALSKVGIPATLEMAQRLGITTLGEPSNYGLALALGAGEVRLLDLTSTYATFANNGYKNTPTTIEKIEDKQGQVVYVHEPENQKAVDAGFTFLISSILSDNGARAEQFGNALNISRVAAVKTGTSENYRDSWTMGYTPSLTVGVWVGNNDGTPMDNVAGSLGAAPIWKALMEQFLSGTPTEQFEKPEDVVSVNVCRNNGLVLKDPNPAGYTEYFVKGTEPTGVCTPPAPSNSAQPQSEPSSTQPSTPPNTPPADNPENSKDKDQKDEKD